SPQPLNIGDNSLTSPYLSVRISCPRIVADGFSECLMCFGASSATVDGVDADTDDAAEIWINSLFDIDLDVKDCISRAADSVGLNSTPGLEVEMLDHTDWIRKTQDSFHPVEVAEGFWIVPEWREPPVPEAINIILNPGLAFGTGEHPTTKLCLLQLRELIKGGEYVLDYGTGSGILAIAALKLGAAVSVGFDIEPQAITSLQSNAVLNGVGPDKLSWSLVAPSSRFETTGMYRPELVAENEKYDLVIANILLNPLLDLGERLVSYAKPGAAVCLSGIIFDQVPPLIRHFSRFLEDVRVTVDDDWACVKGTKK
ncbi:hypothetical protein M569_05682, partial [Genlisea aurea]